MRRNRSLKSLILILCLLAGGLLSPAEKLLTQEPPEEEAPLEEPAPPEESGGWIEPSDEDEPSEPSEEPPADETWQEPAETPWQAPVEEPAAEPAPEPAAEPVEAPAGIPVQVPEPPRKSETPAKTTAKPAKPAGESFRVRLAEAGKGFRTGVAGQLRVTSSGLAFTRDGGGRADWSISWRDLQTARKESGLWDAPFVLGLVERDGRRRYIARLDKNGRYLDGAPILAAIVRTGGTKFK